MQEHVTDEPPRFPSSSWIKNEWGINWNCIHGSPCAHIPTIVNEDADFNQRSQWNEQWRRSTTTVVFVVGARSHGIDRILHKLGNYGRGGKSSGVERMTELWNIT